MLLKWVKGGRRDNNGEVPVLKLWKVNLKVMTEDWVEKRKRINLVNKSNGIQVSLKGFLVSKTLKSKEKLRLSPSVQIVDHIFPKGGVKTNRLRKSRKFWVVLTTEKYFFLWEGRKTIIIKKQEHRYYLKQYYIMSNRTSFRGVLVLKGKKKSRVTNYVSSVNYSCTTYFRT